MSWSGCCLALQQTSPSVWLSALGGTCALHRLGCYLQCSTLPCASADLVHVRCLPERRCKDTTKNRVCQEFWGEIFKKSAFFVIFERIGWLKVLFSLVLSVNSAARLFIARGLTHTEISYMSSLWRVGRLRRNAAGIDTTAAPPQHIGACRT